jgi:hypothetical protein
VHEVVSCATKLLAPGGYLAIEVREQSFCRAPGCCTRMRTPRDVRDVFPSASSAFAQCLPPQALWVAMALQRTCAPMC